MRTWKVFPSRNASLKSRSEPCPGGNCEVSSGKKSNSCKCHLPETHPRNRGRKGTGMGSKAGLRRARCAQISAGLLPVTVTPSPSGKCPCLYRSWEQEELPGLLQPQPSHGLGVGCCGCSELSRDQPKRWERIPLRVTELTENR